MAHQLTVSRVYIHTPFQNLEREERIQKRIIGDYAWKTNTNNTHPHDAVHSISDKKAGKVWFWYRGATYAIVAYSIYFYFTSVWI